MHPYATFSIGQECNVWSKCPLYQDCVPASRQVPLYQDSVPASRQVVPMSMLAKFCLLLVARAVGTSGQRENSPPAAFAGPIFVPLQFLLLWPCFFSASLLLMLTLVLA